MRKLLLLIGCLVSFNSHSQTFIKYWDKCYGGSNGDLNPFVGATINGQLIFAGSTDSPISGNKTSLNCTSANDVWLVNTDTSGTIIWNNNYGGAQSDASGGITELANGNIIVSCYTASDSSCNKTENGRGNSDCWIFLADSNGTILWDRTYGGSDADATEEPPVCALSINGNIVLANTSKSPISGDKTDSVWNFTLDYWILYLDSAGNKLWDRSYGGMGDDVVRTVCTTSDGNILVGGMAQSIGGGDVTDSTRGGINDYWIIKLDTAGNKIWDRLYGGNGDENLRAMKPTPDGGAILCGWTYSQQGGDVTEPPKGSVDAWVVKIDSLGNKQWDKRYGGANALLGTDVLAYEDGYLIAATTNSIAANDVSEPPFGGNDYWVLKIDSIGNKRWDKRFGGNFNDELPKLAVLADNSIVVAGFSDSDTSSIKTDPGYGWEDYWAIRFKYIDNSVGVAAVENANGVVKVYPNPAGDEITIASSYRDKATILIYDQMGKAVYAKENTLLNTHCDISGLAKGIYFLNVKGSNINEVVKAVKM